MMIRPRSTARHVRENRGQQLERLDAHLRRAELDPGANLGVAHPSRQLPHEPRPVLDQKELRPAAPCRLLDTQAPPEEGMPGIFDPREPRSVSWNGVRLGGLIKVLWHDGQGMCLFSKRPG